MIQINDNAWVAADEISEVTIDGNRIRVKTKRGEVHVADADYGKGIYATADRLLKEIETKRSSRE